MGLPVSSLSPHTLTRKAQKTTGMNYPLNELQNEALQRLCESAEHDACLHPLGRFGVASILVSAIENNLRWQDYYRVARPAVPQLNKPCLVVGLPRSGTTLLHRLLSLAEDARALKTWEVQHPLPPTIGTDNRRKRVQRQLTNLYKMVPELAVKHTVRVDDAEEDFWLLNASLLSATFFVFAPLYSYETWWRDQEMTDAYRIWSHLLGYFQRQSPEKRLTLKAPIHTAFIEEILTVNPHITLVQTHRDPVKIAGSLNSLFHTLQISVSNLRNTEELGERTLDRMAWIIDRNLDARESCSGNILDIQYNDIVDNPAETVAMIHDQLEIPFTNEHNKRIERFLSNQHQREHGHHSYSLDECGLQELQVKNSLSRYYKQFFS